jgi:AraC family transcriptional regulator
MTQNARPARAAGPPEPVPFLSFKQSFGMPPHRYHTGQRIERAKTMLAKSYPSVIDIGFTAGFRQTTTVYHRSLSETQYD